METLILICLILIIILLLHDKVYPAKELKKPNKPTEQQSSSDNIMGQPKKAVVEHDPKNITVASLEAGRYDQNNIVEDGNSPALSEADDAPVVDYDEEEEEWRNHFYIQDDHGFAEGVTFEELQSFHDFIKSDQIGTANNGQLLETTKKIQGTELFSLLQSSVEGASKKIAQLLDSTFDTPNLSRDDQRNSFNINDYL